MWLNLALINMKKNKHEFDKQKGRNWIITYTFSHEIYHETKIVIIKIAIFNFAHSFFKAYCILLLIQYSYQTNRIYTLVNAIESFRT